MTSPKAVNSGKTEREAFEADYAKVWNAAMKENGWSGDYTAEDVAALRDGDTYGEGRDYLNARWEGWQARAAPTATATDGNPFAGFEAYNAGYRKGIAAAPQGLTDDVRQQIDSALDMLMCAMRAANWEGDAAYRAGEKARALLAEQSAAPMADDVEDDDIQPTPESERAAFNAMMRWHLIRLLQAWRYGGDLRAAGMAAFEWARSNDVGKAAFEASERAVKLSPPLPRASEQADEAVTSARYIVIGYGESDHPQAAFVNERDALLDAVLGMMFMHPSDADEEIRESYRADLADDDEWSHDGIWRTEFEIGGIVIYDLGYGTASTATTKEPQ